MATIRAKRGNDAIPSWSGFNYQGKVSLLHILIKMNDLFGQNLLSGYFVELEKREDFVIINNDQPESFNQVKATLSKSKWSSHASALDKLLQHRNDSDPTAKCSFIAANEISDWNASGNSYKSSISIFTYSGKNVGVCDVKGYILNEINKYIVAAKYVNADIEVIYGELCVFLEQKIAVMHEQGTKNREYKIAFLDFEKIINDAVGKQRARDEYYLKEKVYEYVTGQLQGALESICTHKCGRALLDCETLCAAKSAYQNILGLPDLIRYCKVINPNRLDGWNNYLQLVTYLPKDKIEKDILSLFEASKTPDKVGADDSTVFLFSRLCNSEYIVPTLLDLSTYFQYGQSSLQETFQNIKDNTDITNFLDGKAITAIPGGYEGFLTQIEITSKWSEYSRTRIDRVSKGIEIISVKEILDKFRAEGGNHD